ncbi:hypothetical protein [uncultured Cohaesibacter sp.]|uniref:hypothetical protein n=1 Tax=uncultured Cohaesibacter sp. TaxID=1002546 RepID=UPI0029C605A6|nr:hypothetical protein [uncultured Cohaesibacter sp.]
MIRLMQLTYRAVVLFAVLAATQVHAGGEPKGPQAGAWNRMPLLPAAANCPDDPREAARDLWPMAAAFGPRMTRLRGKHACGQWVQCDRAFPARGWRCRWQADHRDAPRGNAPQGD